MLDGQMRRQSVVDANGRKVPVADLVGSTVNGVREQFALTEGGIMAAMHRQGGGAVRGYLEWLTRNGMDSRGNIERIKDAQTRRTFKSIETRLREFSNVRLQP